MAWIQERGGSYRVFFRFRGKQLTFPLGKVSKQEAEAKAAQVDYLLLRLKQGLVELPPGVDIAEFVQHDGRRRRNRRPPPRVGNAPSATLRDRFLATHAARTRRTRLSTARIHFNH